MRVMRTYMPSVLLGVAGLCLAAGSARAADIPISARKLLILDKLATSGRAKVVFVSRDENIAKGPSTDPAQIEATLQIYSDDAPENYALFELPSPWLENGAGKAKYLNLDAPTGGGVKVAIVKPGRLAKIVAKSAGDQSAIDIVSTPPGPNGITVVLSIHDASDSSTTRLCTHFGSADVTPIAGGTGRKLLAYDGQPVVCKGGNTILMQPNLPGGFFSMPWPNDIRHKANGTIDLAGYPGSNSNAIFNSVLTKGSAATRAFGTNAAIFMRSTALLDPASLPSADESTTGASPILLVNLDDPGSPASPLLVDFKNAPSTYRPGNLLTSLPYPGHPLEEETRYAVIVLEGVHDTDGLPLLPAPLIDELQEPWDAGKPVTAAKWAELQAQRADVLAYIDQYTSWQADEIVAFSVFTTQDTTSEMDAIFTATDNLPPPTPVSRGTGDCSPPGAQRTTVSGVLDLPKWQAGTYPYSLSGGGIVVVGGAAVQQGVEQVDFEMTFPCGPAPVDGWPILLFMDGTGGSAESASIAELGFAPLPYVVASIAPLYSGDREVPGSPPELLFFNYLNPLAGRTNQLQQAGDMIYLRRVVEGIVLDAAETGAGGPVQTDDTVVVIVGHSQGAITIPQVLAVDPAFDGGYISAGGAGFYHNIVHRADVRSIVDGILGTPPGELDIFHPIAQVLQVLAEVGDAGNYARRIDTAHVASIGGTIDGCSPLEVVQHLATALGHDVANPLFHPMFGSAALEPSTTTLPAGGNLAGGRTGVTIQLDTGHFGASTNPQIGRTFVESLAAGGTPTVNPGPLSPDSTPGCSGRYDPL